MAAFLLGGLAAGEREKGNKRREQFCTGQQLLLFGVALGFFLPFLAALEVD